MKIWICIPVFNRKDLTLKCLASLQKQTYINFKIVICDHGSTDGTTEAIHEQYPNVIVINADSSLWWTGAINLCVKYVGWASWIFVMAVLIGTPLLRYTARHMKYRDRATSFIKGPTCGKV